MGQKKEVHVYFPMARHPEIGDKSFDYCLNQLLDKRRDLSRNLLAPPVSKDDLNSLKQSVFVGSKNSVPTQKNSDTITDINCMEPRQFEAWVANECRQAGLIVKNTPESWDGGADIIIESIDGDIVGIIQCKHTQSEEAPYTAVSDLIRACNSYSAKSAKMIAITNANRFNAAAEDIAKQNTKIILINAANLLKVGSIINRAIHENCKSILV
jgi:HJR/Mrr/RecB family endonuclease